MFKEGDKVRGIKADKSGCEGIIEEVREKGYSIRITKRGQFISLGKEGDLCTRDTFWEDCLELIEKDDKFNEGDKVKIKRNCSGCIAGRVYELQYGNNNGYHSNQLWASIGKLESGGGCHCQGNWEKVETKIETKFKIGDKVRIVKRFKENNSGNGKEMGIGYILNESSAGGFHPKQYDGQSLWSVWAKRERGDYIGMFIAEELELENEDYQFKVGDKVRAISESHGWGKVRKGDIGRIASCGDKSFYADFPAQLGWHGELKDFELVKEKVEKVSSKIIKSDFDYPVSFFATLSWGYSSEKSKPTKMNKLTNRLKRLFNEPQRILYKANYIDECGDLTDRGDEELAFLVRDRFEEELVNSAKADLEEEKKGE